MLRAGLLPGFGQRPQKETAQKQGKWIPAIASAAAAIAVFVRVSLAGTGGSSDYADVKGKRYRSIYGRGGGSGAGGRAPWQRDVNEESARGSSGRRRTAEICLGEERRRKL